VVDDIMEVCEDLAEKLMPSFLEKDPEIKKKMREELATGSIPSILGNIEKHIQKTSPSHYVVGNSITVADLKLAGLIRWLKSGSLDHIPTDIPDRFPRIISIYKNVTELEVMKK